MTGDDDQAELVGTPDQLRSDDSDDSDSDDFGEIRALLMSNVEAGPDLDVTVHREDDEDTISGEVDAFKEGFSKVRLDTADQEWSIYSRIEIDGLTYDIIDISALSMDQVEDFPMAEEEKEKLGDYPGVIDSDGPRTIPRIRETEEGKFQTVEGHRTMEASFDADRIRHPVAVFEYENHWQAASDFIRDHVYYKHNNDSIEDFPKSFTRGAKKLFGAQAVLLERLGAYIDEACLDDDEKTVEKGDYELELIDGDSLSNAAGYVAEHTGYEEDKLEDELPGYDREKGREELKDSFEPLDKGDSGYSIYEDIERREDVDLMQYIPEDIRMKVRDAVEEYIETS